MSDLTITDLWFKRAVPSPTKKNFHVQHGVHFEEVGEMIEQLAGADAVSENFVREIEFQIKRLATALKTGQIEIAIKDRKEYLDALCDQIVTATGCGHTAAVNVPKGLERVNASNFSKFDENGMPIFDENGKIAKNMATYKKADFEGLY